MFASAHPNNQSSFFNTGSPRQSSGSHRRQYSLSLSNTVQPAFRKITNKKSKISNKILVNLQHLSSILQANDPTIMSLSLTEQQYVDDYIQENVHISPAPKTRQNMAQSSQTNIHKSQQFDVFSQLLSKSNSPFECVSFYTKLLSYPQPNIKSQPILYSTLFSSQIHPIITLYLQDHTQFYQIRECNQKILDIFYKYVFCEYSHLMQKNLKNSSFINLGKWFYEEGIQNLFRKYYPTAQQFTQFFILFLKYGLSAIFIGAVNILDNKNILNTTQTKLKKEINIVKVAYIQKYGIL